MSPNKDRYFITSLQKGLNCLNGLAGAMQGMTLREIARHLDTTSATASRLCHTLMVLGYAHRDERKRYFLTPKVLSLGYSYLAGLPSSHVIHEHLRRLSDQINETVNLAILEGTDIIFLMRIAKKSYPLFDIRTGTRFPAYCTAMGKAILAFSPPDIREFVLSRSSFKPITAKTILGREALEQELSGIERRGFACSDEELSVGNRSIAVPVLNQRGRAVAAINVGVLTTEYSQEQMITVFLPSVLSTARAITDSLQAMMDPFHVGAPLLGRPPDGG